MTLNLQASSSSGLGMGSAIKTSSRLSDSGLSSESTMRRKSVMERVRETFQGWMVSPTFYRISINNIFTRWFALRRTKQVFDLMAGFVNFQVLLTTLKCGVLDAVYKEPSTLEQISEQTQLPNKNLEPLILSAVALGLIEQRAKGLYAIGHLGLPVVAYGGIRAMVEHNAVLYKDMLDTVGLIRRTSEAQMNEYWPYAKLKKAQQEQEQEKEQEPASGSGHDVKDQFARYSELMSASQNFVIDEIINAYDFSHHSKMLDIGCGKGRFATEVAQKYSHLKFELMDLPQVIELTKAGIEKTNLIQRFNFNPASFKTNELPGEVDLVTLVRIAHDHSDEVVSDLLRKIYLSLPSKGVLLLAEPMAEPSLKGAKHDAYFHFYLLAMGEGRLRTPETLSEMMMRAGFEQIKLLSNSMPIHARILVAQKY